MEIRRAPQVNLVSITRWSTGSPGTTASTSNQHLIAVNKHLVDNHRSPLNHYLISTLRCRYADVLDSGEKEPAKPSAAARRPRPARARPQRESTLSAAHSSHPWVRAVDAGTGRAYYFNCRTGLSQWNPPPEMTAERGLIRCRRATLAAWRAAAAAGGGAAAAAAAGIPRVLRAALVVQRWWKSIAGPTVRPAANWARG
jgi:hypothetical protein